MDAFAFSNEFPIISLARSGVQKARVPNEWRGYSTSIDKMDCELIVRNENIHRTRIGFNYQSAHSTPPETR